MARSPELDAAVSAVNAATNQLSAGVTSLSTALDALSARVFALTEKISTRMSDAEVSEVKTALDVETNKIDQAVLAFGAIATSLDGIAADPVVVVPDPIPDPVEELPADPVPAEPTV